MTCVLQRDRIAPPPEAALEDVGQMGQVHRGGGDQYPGITEQPVRRAGRDAGSARLFLYHGTTVANARRIFGFKSEGHLGGFRPFLSPVYFAEERRTALYFAREYRLLSSDETAACVLEFHLPRQDAERIMSRSPIGEDANLRPVDLGGDGFEWVLSGRANIVRFNRMWRDGIIFCPDRAPAGGRGATQ